MQNHNSTSSYNSQSHKCTFRGITVSVVFLIFLLPCRSLSQDKIEYEEISISLYVQGIGTTEIPALIRDQDIYLPVNDIFNFLKIKNTVSPGIDSVTGFFINPKAPFLIDKAAKKIIYEDKIFNLNPDELIRTETNLYLKINYFGDVFGLMCTFNFRNLSVILNTKIELPAIREMRIEQMRKNIRRLNGEIKADTSIGREYPLFQLGMADWSVSNINQFEGAGSYTKFNVALGGILAGGELKINTNYSTDQPLVGDQQYFLWRYANNDNNVIKQIILGNINTGATSSLYSPVIGIQLTNTPTAFRRSFGYCTLSDYTQPGWTVELYENDVLVDYVKADDIGFYTFKVPLVYGNSQISLHFYGPWGEERTTVQNISIPYNFLPVNEFEYTVTSGVVEDSSSFFSRAGLNYGLNRDVTIGGGMEYLSSLSNQNAMPFLKSSVSITPNLLFFGEYDYGVESSGILSYHTPSDLQLDLNYTIYNKNQKAINTDNLEERKAAISMPFRFNDYTLLSRFNIDQYVLPDLKYTLANLSLSSFLFDVGVNINTNATFISNVNPYLTSNLVLSFRLPERFVIRPEAQFVYNQNQFSLIKCQVEKQLAGKISITANFERYLTYNAFDFQLGIRYEFPFAQTSSSFSYGGNASTLNESASGSFMYAHNSNLFEANKRTSVGKCGIVIVPFLDIYGNGRRDPNEPKVTGLNIHIESGRIEFDDLDSTIHVYDLEPYTNYFIELDNGGFNNIAWQMEKHSISVSVDPNQFKLVEVPIAVMGEASGIVYLKSNEGKNGQGRIYVCFYNTDSVLVARVLSESDGYFSFLGLKPGLYTARIDTNQLKNVNMNASPTAIPFKILPSIDGTVVDGLEFVLEHTKGTGTLTK
jgi:hypothetical protein